MAASATKLPTPSATEPATPLERLHADRAGLTSKLAALNASSARLSEAANAEAAVLREIGVMGSAEIAAMTAWAAAGCVGDQPTPDLKLRRTLGEKLATAQAAAAAAAGASEDINHQISQHTERLALINDQIQQAIFDKMETEHGHIIAQYRAVCEHGSQLAAKIHGLASYYGETGRTLISRGDQDRGATYLQRASALTNIKLPNPGVSRLEIEAAAHEWSRRANVLRLIDNPDIVLRRSPS
jgi:hypothetical protein